MQHAQPAYYELYNSYFPTFALYPLDYIVGRGPSSMRNFESFWADLGQALHSEFGMTIEGKIRRGELISDDCMLHVALEQIETWCKRKCLIKDCPNSENGLCKGKCLIGK